MSLEYCAFVGKASIALSARDGNKSESQNPSEDAAYRKAKYISRVPA